MKIKNNLQKNIQFNIILIVLIVFCFIGAFVVYSSNSIINQIKSSTALILKKQIANKEAQNLNNIEIIRQNLYKDMYAKAKLIFDINKSAYVQALNDNSISTINRLTSNIFKIDNDIIHAAIFVKKQKEITCLAYFSNRFKKGFNVVGHYKSGNDKLVFGKQEIDGNNLEHIFRNQNEMILDFHNDFDDQQTIEIMDFSMPICIDNCLLSEEDLHKCKPVGYLRLWLSLENITNHINILKLDLNNDLNERIALNKKMTNSYISKISVSLKRIFLFLILLVLVLVASIYIYLKIQLNELINQNNTMHNEIKLYKTKLMDAAHQAGIAEMATGVLHNIGNILTGVVISTNNLRTEYFGSAIAQLTRVEEILVSNKDNMTEFLLNDEKGKKIPKFFVLLSQQLNSEYEHCQQTLLKMKQGLNIVNETIQMQQSHASIGFYEQNIDLEEELESILSLYINSIERGGIEIVRQYQSVRSVKAQRAKIGNVISNLIKNARDATFNSEGELQITLSIGLNVNSQPFLSVADTGCGFDEEVGNKIFDYGFTTKDKGNGFGLHHSANAMREIGGELTAFSAGLNQGAIFTMTFDINSPA